MSQERTAQTVASRRPLVAIVGRPNVGKSTLFNRLVGGRKALVEDIPGTTRDRLYAEVEWGDRAFTLVDTGGLDPGSEEAFATLIRRQVEIALAEADVILFVVDASQGPTATDLEIAELLRRTGRQVLLVANKADNDRRQQAALQFYELGLGEPIVISAYHDLGVDELRRALMALLPPVEAATEPPTELALAIVGRPNVGKSMLLNAVLGQERVVVSEVPGTTRDAVDTPLEYRGRRLLLIDTAGIRRRGRIAPGLERHSVERARQAVRRCDVALLVIDATEGVTAQDTHIAGLVLEECKGLIVVANKWDLMPDTEESRRRFAAEALARLKFVPWAPLAFVSAKTGLNLEGLLDLVVEIGDKRRQRVPTSRLNAVIREAVARHPPPMTGKRQFKVYYVTQPEVDPPTFVFFCNDPNLLHFSYRRYLENAIRRHFDFEGTAIRMVFRGRGEG
ncbi:MAG: ribosome biogenesis GTPase Der [Dehalococcoidia bacterium]|jgi:GTP-binding protein|nr:ribosome biogenesis GTPase Der [Dehalococcoidia bacterium]MDW8009237.1 ribosome biogenesis GTPase Der [Chloroflexota bacterium]